MLTSYYWHVPLLLVLFGLVGVDPWAASPTPGPMVSTETADHSGVWCGSTSPGAVGPPWLGRKVATLVGRIARDRG